MDPTKVIEGAIAAIEAQDGEAALVILRDLVVSLAGGTPSDGGGDALDDAPDPAPEAAAALAALTEIQTALGATDTADVIARVKAFAASAASAAANAAAVEENSRIELVGELVKLGAEIPATAWVGDAKDRKPAARFSAEPIAELRARVVALRAAKGKPTGKTPPARGEATRAASPAVIAYCKKHGITIEQFQARKAAAAHRA